MHNAKLIVRKLIGSQSNRPVRCKIPLKSITWRGFLSWLVARGDVENNPVSGEIGASGRRDWRVPGAFVALFIALLLFTACATLPEESPPRSESYALPPAVDGKLAAFAKTMAAKHGEQLSAFWPIEHNVDALRWRLMMADLAEHSLDAKYFIWEDDDSANLVAELILAAADRGVRVRILIDDLKLLGAEEGIATVSQHPNVQIRVFNPWTVRDRLGLMWGIEFLTHMKALNRRMHNKMFVADNHVAIFGGRNIGDEYFGFSTEYNFRDLELLAVGPVAKDLSESFDLYWNSEYAYPGEAMVAEELDPNLLDKLRAQLREEELTDSPVTKAGFSTERQEWNGALASLEENMIAGPGLVVYDDLPSTTGEQEYRLMSSLPDLAADAEQEILIASAYFVPDEQFIEDLRDATSQGIRIKIITNSLASLDESGVSNSAYKKWRRPLIEAGAELYEFRHDAADKVLAEAQPVQPKRMAYHSKYIIVDRKRVYVGSLNLTPRSAYLNTENGVVVEGPELANQLAEVFERDISPQNAWQVNLDGEDRLIWESSAGTVYRQPALGFWQRFLDGFFTILPLDNQI